MQDIIKKYKKSKSISNAGIVVMSLFVAFGVNFLLIDGTEIGSNLKTSVLNANSTEDQSDIYFENNNNIITIKTNKNINKAKSISLSMVYNPENITITNFSSDGNNISNIGNENGISSIIINLKDIKNINKGENIVEFNIEKQEEKSENINIINANFTDEAGEIYLLSTSGITF